MLPRIPLSKVVDETANAVQNTVNQSRLKGNSIPSMPIIPPRLTDTMTILPSGSGDTSWYVVLSPRETRGLSGPFSTNQLKQMYKSRDISDRTLVWREGENSWQQLIHQSLLRSQLISIPLVPPRLGNYNSELAVFDPIVEVPRQEILEQAIPIYNSTFDRTCAICGAMAVAHIPGYGEQRYDLYKGRSEVGTNENASEILPGFLWVGSAGASKPKFLLLAGITLLINCTENLKNPLAQPPHFRCREIPMKEKPTESFSEKESKQLLDNLERIYDVIENERLNPEKNVLSDAAPKYHRGPIDEYGFPIKGADDKPFRRPGDSATTPFFPPRVIIWSRLGSDRAVVITVAYLIKQFGISLRKAIKIMKKNRPGTDISPAYMLILEKWSKKYTLGMLLCVDCKQVPLLKDQQTSGDNETVLWKLREMLTTQLPRLLVTERDKRLTEDVDKFVVGIRENYFNESPWAKIIDINLSDRRLSDATVAVLFQLMGASGALKHIRSLNLSNNEISFLALKAMLHVCFPFLEDPDGSTYSDFADEEQNSNIVQSIARELSVLDLSNNRIETQGAKYLSLFLKLSDLIMWVSLYGNNIPDEGLAEILNALTTPMFDFQSTKRAGNRDSFMMVHHEEDDWNSTAGQSIESMHNRSVTYLDLGGNSFYEQSVAAMSQLLQQNVVLQTLKLEHSTSFSSMYFKDVTNSIRLYNGTLNNLYLSGVSLSVGAAKQLARIHESLDTRIMKLVLNNCGLYHLQLKAMVGGLSHSNFLSYLDISNNKIGPEGTEALVTIIGGDINIATGKRTPPLRHLDVTKCLLEPDNCASLMEAIASREELAYLDISYNDIGASNVRFSEAFGQSSLETALMNYCNMHTSTAVSIFNFLQNGSLRTEFGNTADNFSNPVRNTLRSLCIAGNNISDSAAEALITMLQTNTCIEHIDLGYNNFTNHSIEYFKIGTKVTSPASDARKAIELNINLLGNKCDPYVLDTPGLSRSKITFRFGVLPDKNKMDMLGYGYIGDRARGKFVASKALDDQFRAVFPQQNISTLY